LGAIETCKEEMPRIASLRLWDELRGAEAPPFHAKVFEKHATVMGRIPGGLTGCGENI